VETTEQMRRAVMEALPRATVVIKAAAPVDFRPVRFREEKLPKESLPSTLELERTPDILQEVGRRKESRFLVGFAAGTADLLEAARRKLAEKHLDLIVANEIGKPGAGFESDTNRVTLLDAGGRAETLPEMSKREVAARLLDRIESERGPAK
jgi:phosphopantothenoylcysteine decarboxylase/phosphopantothenate--cysteine ligase